MAAGLADLFGGKKTDNGSSGEFDLAAGAYQLEWTGTLTNGTFIELAFKDAALGADWHPMDPDLNINPTSPYATNFLFAACKVRATVQNANRETSVAVGIKPLS